MVEELEQSLQDAKNHYTTAQMVCNHDDWCITIVMALLPPQEAETLRHSLHHELEMKAQIELQMEEVSATHTHSTSCHIPSHMYLTPS